MRWQGVLPLPLDNMLLKVTNRWSVPIIPLVLCLHCMPDQFGFQIKWHTSFGKRIHNWRKRVHWHTWELKTVTLCLTRIGTFGCLLNTMPHDCKQSHAEARGSLYTCMPKVEKCRYFTVRTKSIVCTIDRQVSLVLNGNENRPFTKDLSPFV